MKMKTNPLSFRYPINPVRLFLLVTMLSGVIFISFGIGNNVSSLTYRDGVSGAPASLLRVNPANGRYFTDGSGKAVYLTGSHTWANFQDIGYSNPPPVFDYNAYLDFLQANNHNLFRLWVWEQAKGAPWATNIWVTPPPYQRSGPGTALDGNPKFDLTKFDQAYFDRMRSRIIQAGDRGIYASVMLFDGFSVGTKNPGDSGNPWIGHPFNAGNNINGIDGDTNHDGKGYESQTLSIAAVTAVQDAYVRKVIDTVNDLDNVLYEICNECELGSRDWQYHIIDLIHQYESTKPKQHPVGMTVAYPNGSNTDLFNGPADWVSPNDSGDYKNNPPVASGNKVIVVDTDHLWGEGGDRVWVWKSFTRGLNPIYMDCYNAVYCSVYPATDPTRISVISNLGYVRTYASRMNLNAMTPTSNTSLCSTGYCLRNAVATGAEYLVYRPATSGNITVNLSAVSSSKSLNVEWFNPNTGSAVSGGTVNGGASRTFTAPFSGDAILYIYDTVSSTPTPTPTSTPYINNATFADVPATHWAWKYIEAIYDAGITGGCSVSPLNYCPEEIVTRAQMAVFLEKGLNGSIYSPPVAPLTFTDINGHWARYWIEALKSDNITGGCGAGIYCPDNSVTRAQMAVFLLKSRHGIGYTPPVASGTIFADVSNGYWSGAWIEQLASEGITGGCGNGNYCPETSVTRAQMAVFLQKTFNLPMP